MSTYKKLAQEAFIHTPRNHSYTKEFKDEVVQEYVLGKGALLDLAIKYNLSDSSISKGVQVYYHGGVQKAYYAQAGQLVYEKHREACKPKVKLLKVKRFIHYAIQKIKVEKWSPDVIVGRVKEDGCLNTMSECVLKP